MNNTTIDWDSLPIPDEDEERELLEEIIQDYEERRDYPVYMLDSDGLPKIVGYEEIPHQVYLDAKKRLKELEKK